MNLGMTALLRGRRLVLAWIAIAAMAGVAALVGWKWTGERAQAVTTTLQIQREFDQLLSAAQDIETGQRGYLLTKDPTFLEPYKMGRSNLAASLSQLREHFDDRHQDVGALARFELKIKELLAQSQAPLDKVDSGGGTVSAATLLAGKVAMDELRVMIADAQFIEEARFKSEEESYRRGWLSLLAAVVVALTSSIGLSMIAFSRERERYRAADEVRRSLQSSNFELEKRVEERTLQLSAEAKRAQEEHQRAEALLRDGTHRIGNMLALVVGFLNLHIRHSGRPEVVSALTSARNRIHTIASAQRRMNVTNDLALVRLDELFEAVIRDIIDVGTASNVKVSVDARPMLVNAQVSTSLCVLMQEFVMNAIKHGFADVQTGSVSVSVRPAEKGCIMEIVDDGRGRADDQVGTGLTSAPAAAPEASRATTPTTSAEGGVRGTNGLGSKIAELLSSQFDGSIAIESAGGPVGRPGTRVIVTLPGITVTDVEA